MGHFGVLVFSKQDKHSVVADNLRLRSICFLILNSASLWTWRMANEFRGRVFVIRVIKLLFIFFQLQILESAPSVLSFVWSYEENSEHLLTVCCEIWYWVSNKNRLTPPQIPLCSFIFELNQSTVNTRFTKVQVTEFSYCRWSLRKMGQERQVYRVMLAFVTCLFNVLYNNTILLLQLK